MPKATVEMIATKAFRYNTGRVSVGDTFMATPADARLLAAIRKARINGARPPGKLPPPPHELLTKMEAVGQPDDITALRRDYHAALGKRPFVGWDAATLREKIAAARA